MLLQGPGILLDPRESAAHGIMLLGPDRPGYGASDPLREDEPGHPRERRRRYSRNPGSPGNTLGGVAGWSAGGSVALALAARRPDLVSRIVVFSTPAPDEEVPWIPFEHKTVSSRFVDYRLDTIHTQLSDMLSAIQPADPPRCFSFARARPADAAMLAILGTRQRLGKHARRGLDARRGRHRR